MYNSRFQSVRLLDNRQILKIFITLLHESIMIVDPKDIITFDNLPILNTLYINGLVSKRKINDVLYFQIKPVAYEVYKLRVRDKEIAWVGRGIIIGIISFLIFAIACLNYVIYPAISYAILFLLLYLDATLILTAIQPLRISAKYQIHASRPITFVMSSALIVIFFSMITIF